jgi:PPOX class probable F420-dependent enzyme
MPPSPSLILTTPQRTFLAIARRGVLATIAPDGQPRTVPICFVLDEAEPVLWTAIDDKPKRDDDPLALARVRDITADPRVTVLVDRWDEEWARLAWLRATGTAALALPGAPGHNPAILAALRGKYPQYAAHHLESRPVIRIELERATSWGALDPG